MQDAEKWISISNVLSPLVDFAICHVNGSIIGEVGLQALEDIHHRIMEIGYWISRYGHQSHRRLLQLVDKVGRLGRLAVGAFRENPASCRALEKCGLNLKKSESGY
jgi:RimJ/RimL family protein N-acetyltransferase